MGDSAALGDLPLFRGLPSDQLARLNTLVRRRTFPPGTTLITADQPGDLVFIVLSGTVKIHMEQPDGSEVIIAFGGPGDIEGEMSVIENTDRTANVVTQEVTTVLWMDRATFKECLEHMPGINQNLVRILAGRLRLANARIQALCSLDVQGRLARQILGFAQQYGQPGPNGAVYIPLRLTQSDLASLIGASRERVNQIMAHYKQRGYLAVDSSYRITIYDPQALARQYR
jgi:CRP/FNR family transcriptional regulator, cyclic AMP receptor protein